MRRKMWWKQKTHFFSYKFIFLGFLYHTLQSHLNWKYPLHLSYIIYLGVTTLELHSTLSWYVALTLLKGKQTFGGGRGMKKSLYSDFQNSDSTYPVLSNQSGWGKDHICCSYAYNIVLWIAQTLSRVLLQHSGKRSSCAKNWGFKAWFGHLSALAVITSMSFWSVTCAFPNYCRLNSFSKYYFRFTMFQELYRALSL